MNVNNPGKFDTFISNVSRVIQRFMFFLFMIKVSMITDLVTHDYFSSFINFVDKKIVDASKRGSCFIPKFNININLKL